jgi:hypothetical protein
MKLDQKDKDRIVSIVASRYFSEQGWKWIDLNTDISKIHMMTFGINMLHILI